MEIWWFILNKIFITTSIIFSLLFVFSVNASWWNESFPYKYPIYNNHTTDVGIYPVLVDDDIFWALIGNESYIYCEQSGCADGAVAISTDVTENFWENETNKLGFEPHSVYGDTYVASYHLTEANSIDSTPNAITGTAGGDPTVVAGLFGNGLEMDGVGDYVDIDAIKTAGIADHGDFTISFWVKPTVEWNADVGGMGTGTHAGGRADTWYDSSQNGALSILAWDGGAEHEIYYETTLLVDTWYFVAYTFNDDANEAKIYVNGELVKTASSFDWEYHATARGSIGGDYDGNPSSKGVYDEYRFSNVTMDLASIQAEYYKGLGNITTIGAEESNAPAGTTPQWQDLTENTADPVTYTTSQNYGFQVNCTDETGMYNVIFEHNVTGSLTNVTATNDSLDIYYTNITSMEAGVLNYTFYCNSTEGVQNKTNYADFTVNQASSVTGMSLSGTTPLTYGTASDWTGTETNSGDGNCAYNLYRNDTSVSNPDTTVLGVGVYNYTYNTSGCANFTSGEVADYLTVTRGSTSCNLYLNGTDGNRVYDNPEGINVTFVINNTQGTVYIDSNHTGWVQQSSTAPSLENITEVTSIDAQYNFTGFYEQTENYTSCSETHYATVTSNVFPVWSANGTNPLSPQDYPLSQIEFYVNCSDEDGYCQGVNVTFDGNTYQMSNTSDQYNYTLDTSGFNEGVYSFNYILYDNDGAINTTDTWSYKINYAVHKRFYIEDSNNLYKSWIDSVGDSEYRNVFIYNKLRINTSYTPASATDSGFKGEIVWDSDYIYVCVDDNTWKRSALTSW